MSEQRSVKTETGPHTVTVRPGNDGKDDLDRPTDPPPVTLYPPSDPKLKIQLTEHGLLFSGHSAFISTHHVRHFVYEDIGHKTVEHGYCFKKAVCYKRMALAKRVRHGDTALDAKDVVCPFPLNP